MLSFLKEFAKNPKCIGAVAPSSRYLAERMVGDIDFENCRCIVEYGPGTGVFTEKIIERKKEETIFLVFENNEYFYNALVNTYKNNKNVQIINDGAENIKKYLQHYQINEVNYIVSGLPFAALPKNITDEILKSTKEALGGRGEFITFQYSLVKEGYFKNYFNYIDKEKVKLNLPPAYVFKCKA